MAATLSHPEIHKLALKSPVADYPSLRARQLGKEKFGIWKKTGMIKWGKKTDVWYEFVEDAKKWVMYEKARAITCPVLIIHGRADKLVPYEWSQQLASNMPNAVLFLMDKADHALAVNGDRSVSNKKFADWLAE
jgi:pimeloyl-ACP methyl ester carboxylesterase